MSQPNEDQTAHEQYQLLELSNTTSDVSPARAQVSEESESGVLERPFVVPRKPLPHYASVTSAIDSEAEAEDTTPRIESRLLTWRPFYLRKLVLAGFVLWFCILIAVLETIYQVSQRQHGLINSESKFHYLWTYGPSALFIVTAMFWARVEYQSKELAPWQSMAGKEVEATKSILLDYISAFQPLTVYTALLNRHFTVAAASVVSLLFKVLVVFSTALIVLFPTRVTFQHVPIVLSSTFGGDLTDLNRTGTLPFMVLEGIQKKGLHYTLGVTEDLAYQTFNSSINVPDPVLGASVDAIFASLECQEAQMIVNSWYVEVDSGTPSSIVPMTFGEQDFVVDGCRISSVFIGSPTAVDGNITQSYAVYAPGYCGQSTADSDGRVVLAAGTVVPSTVTNITGSSYLVQFTNFSVVTSTQYICRPTLELTTAMVSINQSNTINATIHSAQTPNQSVTTVNGLSAWDFVKIQAVDSVATSISTGYLRTLPFINAPVALEIGLGLNQAGLSNITFDELSGNGTLIVAANRYFSVITALYAHLSLSSPANVSSYGTAEVVEPRLQVEMLSVRVMESVLALVTLLTLVIIFRERRLHALPRCPSTLIALATLVEHSKTLLSLLRGTGSLSNGGLQQQLAGRRYISGIVGVNDDTCFAIHVGHQGRKSDPPPFIDQSRTKNNWQPFIISRLGRGIACCVLVAIIALLELILWTSNKHYGLSNASPDRYVHYVWAYVPATIAVAISIWYSAIDFDIRCVAPYLSLKKGSSASRTVNLWYLDEISGTTLMRSVKRKQWTVFVTTVAAIIGSTLTIAVSGVYSTSNPTSSSQIIAEAKSLFATTYDDTIYLSPTYGTEFGDGGHTAGLVIYANLSFPAWTYNELALPQLSVEMTKGPLSKPSNQSYEGEVRARVTATRSNYQCRMYDFGDFRYSLNWTAPSDNLKVNVSDEYCGTFGVGSLRVNRNEYFGAATYNTEFCSESFYVWGQTDQAGISYMAAMGCNETFNEVEADIVLISPALAVSSDQPPTEDATTLRSSNAYFNALEYSQLKLPTLNTPSNSNLDQVFQAVVYGKDGIPLEDLGDRTKASIVMNSTNHVNSVLRAQYFNENLRIPVNSSTAPPPFNATFTWTVLRVVQDPVASRILEGLLAAMLICTIIAIILADVRDVVPKNPCSIAAKTSLLADSSLVTRKFLPEDADRMSDEELAALVKGHRFGMGWLHDDETGQEVFKVDVIDSGERVSRVSVRPK